VDSRVPEGEEDVITKTDAFEYQQLLERMARAEADRDTARLRIRALEVALDDIASRTDWDRDDCGKWAAAALATAETKS
jgi:hypothetical protein